MRVQIAAAAALASLIAAADTAEACRCVPVTPGPAAAKRADVVFEGRVVSLERGGPFDWPYRADFVVSRVFRGEAARVQQVDLGRTSCSITGFRPGQEWVVFARRGPDGALSTRQCMGTTRLSQQRGEPGWLQSLGPGERPAVRFRDVEALLRYWLAVAGR